MNQLKRTLHDIDQLHAQDPDQINGKAKELIYAENMTHWLERLNPDAPDELRIAVRSQHLCRWEMARSAYPMDRVGYLTWRTDLSKMHARKASGIMASHGYSAERCKQTESIIRKLQLKKKPDAQTLEDCACLVFIETGLEDFAEKHPEEKIINIVKKTWGKMSPTAQKLALEIKLSDKDEELIAKSIG